MHSTQSVNFLDRYNFKDNEDKSEYPSDKSKKTEVKFNLNSSKLFQIPT